MALFISLYSKRATLGWSPSTIHTDGGVTPTSSTTATSAQASASIQKPKRNELATGTELQEGRVNFISAKSLPKIQGFRKGLIVALLLDLDTMSTPIGGLNELWEMTKPNLAKVLWEMVRGQFSLSALHFPWPTSDPFVAPKGCST